jgi:hypothetical protein
MKKAFMVLLVAVIFIVVMATAVSAGDIVQTVNEKLSLGIINFQSLAGDGNKTAFSGQWKMASIKTVIDLNADVLLAPDYNNFLKWGCGASALIKGNQVNLKLGYGYLETPGIYLGLPLIGADSAMNNLAQTVPDESLEVGLWKGGVGINYGLRF